MSLPTPHSDPAIQPKLQAVLLPSSFLIRLIVSIVLLNLFVFALIWLSANHIRQQHHEQAEVTTRNLSKALENEIAGTIKADELALLAIADEYQRQRATGSIDRKALNANIERMRSRLPEIDILWIADAQGRLQYGNDAMPGATTTIADRPYFIRLRDDPKAGLVISKPLLSRVNAQWVIVLSRRIDLPDGSFDGIVLAAITLEHLSRVFSHLDVGPHGVVALRDDELDLVARHPAVDDSTVDSKVVADKVRKMIHAQPFDGTIRMRSFTDTIERTYSYRRISPYPLYIFIGLSTNDYLFPWRAVTLDHALLAALFTLISLVVAWLIYHSWKCNNNMIDELARQETKFRTVADFTADWEYWLGPKGEILYMTPSCERITGYSVAEFTADPGLLLHVTHPEDRHLVKQHLDDIACQAVNKDSQMDFRIVRRDGNICWIAHHCHAIQDSNGVSMGRRASNRDITDRKHAEQELRIAATAFEEAQEGIFVTDARNVILRVNRAFTHITGYMAEEVVGKTPNILKSGRHDAAFYDSMWEHLLRHDAWQGEIWNRRKNNEVYPEWITITAVKDISGITTNYVATLTDITRRKAAEDEIQHLAFYDSLTNLPNRRLLLDRLRLSLAASTRSKRQGALLFIDLDNFKTLNDTLGHDVGDQLLQLVAQRLVTCVREGDTVARLGGDEFVIMLDNLSENIEEALKQTKAVGEKILATLNQPYLLASHERHSTPSIGATLFNSLHNSIPELLKRADLAMYQAKSAGRNNLCFFDPAMQATVSARAELEADLLASLQTNQFLLYFQPNVDEKGRMTGAEALLRWQHPRRGLLSPADFIPLAEETGLILPLGQWVLETACTQLAAWAARPETAHLTLAVNISPRQFHHPDFAAQVMAVLDKTGADAHKLKLELTESMLMDNLENTLAKMTLLKARGVSFALDNFGINYFSLTYLKRLPLDQLKIDRSIVRDILTDASDATIARTILAMAQNMGLDVIAEGVETGEQRELLAKMSCHAFQGYLFGRPSSKEEFGQPLP